MISIDTDVMRQLVQTTTSANEAIDVAVDALNKITVHNDWGCKEKNSINNYTISNKNKVKNLQDNSRAFLGALTSVSSDFETTENNIKDMFQGIENLLSKFFSVPGVGGKTHIGTNASPNNSWADSLISGFEKISGFDTMHILIGPEGVLKPISDTIISSFDKFEFKQICDKIPICNFIPDINIFNSVVPATLDLSNLDLSNISFSE